MGRGGQEAGTGQGRAGQETEGAVGALGACGDTIAEPQPIVCSLLQLLPEPRAPVPCKLPPPRPPSGHPVPRLEGTDPDSRGQDPAPVSGSLGSPTSSELPGLARPRRLWMG